MTIHEGERLESALAQYEVKASTKHRVTLEVISGLIGLGPITGDITRAWVEYNGEEVTEVPEGENFVVKVSYDAENPGFSASPFDPGWSTAVSVISTGGEIKKCDPTNQFAATQHEVSSLTLGPMPSYDITLRVKLWGNQDMWTSPGVPDCPAQSEW